MKKLLAICFVFALPTLAGCYVVTTPAEEPAAPAATTAPAATPAATPTPTAEPKKMGVPKLGGNEEESTEKTE